MAQSVSYKIEYLQSYLQFKKHQNYSKMMSVSGVGFAGKTDMRLTLQSITRSKIVKCGVTDKLKWPLNLEFDLKSTFDTIWEMVLEFMMSIGRNYYGLCLYAGATVKCRPMMVSKTKLSPIMFDDVQKCFDAYGHQVGMNPA